MLCRQSRNSSKRGIQIVVPEKLRPLVFDQLHCKAGHLGVHKTFEKVKDRYFWPGYGKDILHLFEKCEPCQRRNQPAPTPQAPLGTITSTYPFQKISWDIMRPLPVTEKGSKYILVITDLFSKWVEAFPLSSTNSVTLAEILTDTVICRYGVPEVIHSDQGANFVSEVIQTVCLNLGITRTQTTAYHPQGNGQVERFNRTLESMLSKVVSENHRNLDENLQKVLFAYRTAVHDSTGYTPFLVMFGRSPNLPVDVMLGRYREDSGSSVPKYVQRTRALMKAAFSDVQKRIKKSHDKQKGVADQRYVWCMNIKSETECGYMYQQ